MKNSKRKSSYLGTLTMAGMSLLLFGCHQNPALTLDADTLAEVMNKANHEIVQTGTVGSMGLADCNLYYSGAYLSMKSAFVTPSEFAKEAKGACQSYTEKLAKKLQANSSLVGITASELQSKALWLKYRTSKKAI